MIRQLLSLYSPRYPTVLVYMLQASEYRSRPYLKWLHRTKDFSRVMKRRSLDRTRRARLLLIALRLGVLAQLLIGAALVYLGVTGHLTGGVFFGLALIIVYPLVWPYLILVPLVLARGLITDPKEWRQADRAREIFEGHEGLRIAVLGSYGKTTMKELLRTVLSEKLKVAATPANKNVTASHAAFARTLKGDEDVLIIEYGEGEPGDIKKFAHYTDPDRAVITGLAPVHLDKYPSFELAAKDLFSIRDYVGTVYVNDDSESVKPYLRHNDKLFNRQRAWVWDVKDVKSDLTGTSFSLEYQRQKINLKSQLLGRHNIGFLAFVAAFALEEGLSPEQIQAGVAKTAPFEHRMQPHQLNGAWVIDDTYNGNLEGIRAGTELLAELKAKRKIYVTPGLVDQGAENERVHKEIGRLIKAADPDMVVLMRNSVTGFIQEGLKGYQGELRIEDEPLEFYSNLPHFVAAGDLVVMQNDWTDNYA